MCGGKGHRACRGGCSSPGVFGFRRSDAVAVVLVAIVAAVAGVMAVVVGVGARAREGKLRVPVRR